MKKATEGRNLPAGGFSSWLRNTRRAQKTKKGADVPCGDCTACCTSSYFIHIRPDEADTLARIPKKLVFPAPGLPKGHVLLGYGADGHCPMFIGGKCSIYAHRPQACRDYDCRIFPATGLSPGEDKPIISRQVERWKFDLAQSRDREHIAAVRAAARFLREHANRFPARFVPAHPTQVAMVAIKIYEVFLGLDKASEKGEAGTPVSEVVRAVMAAYQRGNNN